MSNGNSGLADTIVRAAIHPAIGVTRVGNSPSDFFIGPEVTDPPAAAAPIAMRLAAQAFRQRGFASSGSTASIKSWPN